MLRLANNIISKHNHVLNKEYNFYHQTVDSEYPHSLRSGLSIPSLCLTLNLSQDQGPGEGTLMCMLFVEFDISLLCLLSLFL